MHELFYARCYIITHAAKKTHVGNETRWCGRVGRRGGGNGCSLVSETIDFPQCPFGKRTDFLYNCNFAKFLFPGLVPCSAVLELRETAAAAPKFLFRGECNQRRFIIRRSAFSPPRRQRDSRPDSGNRPGDEGLEVRTSIFFADSMAGHFADGERLSVLKPKPKPNNIIVYFTYPRYSWRFPADSTRQPIFLLRSVCIVKTWSSCLLGHLYSCFFFERIRSWFFLLPSSPSTKPVFSKIGAPKPWFACKLSNQFFMNFHVCIKMLGMGTIETFVCFLWFGCGWTKNNHGRLGLQT